jgi:hypothetical protein
MSALPPIADIPQCRWAEKCQKADISTKIPFVGCFGWSTPQRASRRPLKVGDALLALLLFRLLLG